MRLNKLSEKLFEGVEKDTIDVWFDNFADTEKYPSVLPSLGYYNIVNGTQGIATSIASSICQYNLREVNSAMIKLLWNPDISYDEIYCQPDFITGGIILNEKEVKESMRIGKGKSCCIRSVVEYEEKSNALIVKEIPYNVYTNTICKEIIALVEENPLCGIDRVNDLTGVKPNIKIYLKKNANVNRVLKLLYKKTSLQSYYGINMIMLDNGTTPKVFGWKEALQAHLNHEIEVRLKIHKYDIEVIKNRLNIIEGLLVAIANIDEVVQIIRNSNDKQIAGTNLSNRFGFNEKQVEAILQMTLSRLINLEIQSFKNEKEKLLLDAEKHKAAIENKEVLYKEIEDDLKSVAEEFGDERKTKCINLDFTNEGDDSEPIEEKELLIHFTNYGNFYTQESNTLLTSKRGGKGSKIKTAKDEFVIKSIKDSNLNSLLLFTNKGKMFKMEVSELPVNSHINVNQLFDFDEDEEVSNLTTIDDKDKYKYIVFITKNGMVKKSKVSEYNSIRSKGIKALNLKENDCVIAVHFVNEERISIATKDGLFVNLSSEEINPIGRVATGVIGIKLNEGDYVVNSCLVDGKSKYVLSLTKSGLIKKSAIEEYGTCGRATKGRKIANIKDGDSLSKYLVLKEDTKVAIITSNSQLQIDTAAIKLTGRATLGVKGIELKENNHITDMIFN